MITRKVGASEQKAVIQLTARYKRFSEQRRDLAALEVQIQERLDDYEKALITQTRKTLGLMPRSSRLSVKNKSSLQTGRVRQE